MHLSAGMCRYTEGAVRHAVVALELRPLPAYAALAAGATGQAPACPSAVAAALAGALLEGPDELHARLPNTREGAQARRLEEALQLLMCLEVHCVLAAGIALNL